MRAPERLTPHQSFAVEATAPRLLLVASAGSGKTEVLTRRVLRHLEQSRGQTFRILAVTFTVRAAQELKSRIQSSASDEAWRVDADTIHGFALDWLMRFGQLVNVYPDTIVFSDDVDRVAVLSEYVRSLGETVDDSLRGVLRAIDDLRLAGKPGDSANAAGPSVGLIPFIDLYEGYLAALDAENGIDYPGMLSKFLDAADADPSFIGNFQATYRHILVDEGQDLSRAQVALISRLIGPSVDLFVVADDRQSINSFAGGSFQNAKKLVGEAAVKSALVLPHNFRCATAVLSAAEKVAAALRSRPSRASGVENAPSGSVTLHSASSPTEEAVIVSTWLVDLLDDGLSPSILADGEDPTVRPEDVAIIARARWLLDPVLSVLDARGISVSLQTDYQSFLQTPAGRVLSEAIALLNSPKNAPSWRRLNEELRWLGFEETVTEVSLLRQLRDSGASELADAADFLDGLTVENIGRRWRELEGRAEKDGWSGDVASLRVVWDKYAVVVPQSRRDLMGFIRYMHRAQQTRPTDPGIRALTIHKVKGLEFKVVCLVGAYHGAIPDYRASSPEAIDEERRAFYVAITRATRSLLVTYPEVTIDRYGRRHRHRPSPFIIEAGLQ